MDTVPRFSLNVEPPIPGRPFPLVTLVGQTPPAPQPISITREVDRILPYPDDREQDCIELAAGEELVDWVRNIMDNAGNPAKLAHTWGLAMEAMRRVAVAKARDLADYRELEDTERMEGDRNADARAATREWRAA